MQLTDKLYYEVECATAQLLDGPSDQLQRFALYMGLESTTSLSTESVLGWIGDKLKKLGHAIVIKVNEAHATITGASEAVRKRIAQAKAEGPGHNVKLPWSGEAIVRTAVGLSMITASILLLVADIKRRKKNAAENVEFIRNMREQNRIRRQENHAETLRINAEVKKTKDRFNRSINDMGTNTHIDSARIRARKYEIMKAMGTPEHVLLTELHSLQESLAKAKAYAVKGNATAADLRELDRKISVARSEAYKVIIRATRK